MKEAKTHLNQLVDDLCSCMQGRGIAKEILFQGSSYEGIKTIASDLEFDCLVVLEGMPYIDNGKYPPGYKKLWPNDQGLATQSMCEGSYLSPRKILSTFQSELQKSIADLERSEEMKLREHGPAVQIDVYRGDSGCFWYSVDMVPGFEVIGPGGGYHYIRHMYIGKPCKPVNFDRSTRAVALHLTWRRSFSIEETDILSRWNGGCKKMVVRMVKVLREIDTSLMPLHSYIMKTVVMNMERDVSCDWSVDNLAMCFIDVLDELKECLRKGYLPHHFLSGKGDNNTLNLLENYHDAKLDNMEGRLNGLLNDQQKMMKVLYWEKPTLSQQVPCDQKYFRKNNNYHDEIYNDKNTMIPRSLADIYKYDTDKILINLVDIYKCYDTEILMSLGGHSNNHSSEILINLAEIYKYTDTKILISLRGIYNKNSKIHLSIAAIYQYRDSRIPISLGPNYSCTDTEFIISLADIYKHNDTNILNLGDIHNGKYAKILISLADLQI